MIENSEDDISDTSTDLKGTKSYECTFIKFVSKESELNYENSIKAQYTHQMFGEKEIIHGYENLRIQIYTCACCLYPYVELNYDSCEEDADDIFNNFDEVYVDYTQEKDAFIQHFSECSLPLFDYTVTFNWKNNQYLLYYQEMNTKEFSVFYEGFQNVPVWFIESACNIDTSDRNWIFYFLYQKLTPDNKPCAEVKNENALIDLFYHRFTKYFNRPIYGDDPVKIDNHNEINDGELNGHFCQDELSQRIYKAIPDYKLIGYANVYEYYAFPDGIRPRISQFMILPPYQGQSMGTCLLHAINSSYKAQLDKLAKSQASNRLCAKRRRVVNKIKDITAETPTHAFQTMRQNAEIVEFLKYIMFKPEIIPNHLFESTFKVVSNEPSNDDVLTSTISNHIKDGTYGKIIESIAKNNDFITFVNTIFPIGQDRIKTIIDIMNRYFIECKSDQSDYENLIEKYESTITDDIITPLIKENKKLAKVNENVQLLDRAEIVETNKNLIDAYLEDIQKGVNAILRFTQESK